MLLQKNVTDGEQTVNMRFTGHFEKSPRRNFETVRTDLITTMALHQKKRTISITFRFENNRPTFTGIRNRSS